MAIISLFIGLYAQVMTAWGTKHLRGCFRPFVPHSWSLSDGQNLPPRHQCIILLAVTVRFSPRKYLRTPPHPLICSLKESAPNCRHREISAAANKSAEFKAFVCNHWAQTHNLAKLSAASIFPGNECKQRFRNRHLNLVGF